MAKELNFLSGVRIADFCWVGAGPFCTKVMADFGADVVKIESATRPDPLRGSGPFKDGVRGVDRSGYFASRNTGKKSLTVDLKTEGGRALALELIAHSDVVTNSFGPGVMERLGLDYESVKKFKPDIIHLSMPMYGVQGPRSAMVGVGMTISAVTALTWMTAYGENDPVGPGTHYPDHAANPYHAAFAVLAALRHKRLTGRGIKIELAQVESTANFMGAGIVQHAMTGRNPSQVGNRSLSQAPHNVFPCRGQDEWCAIAVEDAAQWLALSELLGRDDLAADASLQDACERMRRRDALEAAVTAWTITRPAETVERMLQERGIAAAKVYNAGHLMADDHLKGRAYWQQVDHPQVGPTTFNAPPFIIDGKRIALRRPPLLGEHTHDIARRLLDNDEARVQRLMEEGALK